MLTHPDGVCRLLLGALAALVRFQLFQPLLQLLPVSLLVLQLLLQLHRQPHVRRPCVDGGAGGGGCGFAGRHRGRHRRRPRPRPGEGQPRVVTPGNNLTSGDHWSWSPAATHLKELRAEVDP